MSGTDANVVAGNYIGTDASGTLALGNSFSGVAVSGGAQFNVIGTDGDGVADAAERNIIAANVGEDGVLIENAGTDRNIVAGNFIGTDVTGSAALGNGFGVVISAGAFNRIGTNGDGVADAAERNVISGNAYSGVDILGTTANDNIVAGNFIGTDITGTADLGNANFGVKITGGASNNLVGTNGDGVADAAERNVISGNANAGVEIDGAASNVIAGNFLGTDVTGTIAIGNVRGVRIRGGAKDNRVGTNGDGLADAAERNLISANLSHGVEITGAGTDENVVAGNFIGTDVTGTLALSNSGVGVRISSGAQSNLIGTNGSNDLYNENERNIISANEGGGIGINGSDSNVVAGNFIGTDVTGSVAFGNGPSTTINIGIGGGAQFNRIGTDANGIADAEERNVISGHVLWSVNLQGTGTNFNVIAGNFIGTDATGTAAVANGAGVTIGVGGAGGGGPKFNRVGTNGDGINDQAERNIISGNTSEGVLLGNGGTEENLVAGNFIGTDVTGTLALGNGTGVRIRTGAANNVIGTNGDAVGDAAEGNTIAFNTLSGVAVTGATTTGNSIRGNSIHSNGGLGIDLDSDGVTANDSDDADAGPNDLQNFPVILAARPGATTHAAGALDSTPDSGFLIEFYANSVPDPSGDGEGQRYLGSTIIVTDAAGHSDFTIDLSAATSSGEWITATATDAAGNTSEFSASVAVDDTPPQVLDILDISPDPRNVGVSAVEVLFSEPIDVATLDADDLTLALNGVDQFLTGPLTFTPSIGDSNLVTIGGLEILTGANGTYTLTVDGTGITDLAGNAGFGSASDSWLMDTIAPLSQVNALPRRATSLTFDVSVTGSDPVLTGGTPSGLSAFDVYVSVDGGAYTLWATLPAGNPVSLFTAQSNHTYAFQSFARDLAGNVETKPTAVEASTYVPDLDLPLTQVDSVDAATATFSVNFSGSDSGGSKLAFIDVFVSIDGGAAQNVATVNTGGVANYSGMLTYQAIADGNSHSYRFYTVGIDGNTNVEAAPSAPADVLVSTTFAAPQTLEVVSFDVQKGALQRSYVRYLDITFNTATGLQEIVDSLTDADASNDRIQLTQFDLNGGNGTARTLTSSMIQIVGQTIQIDFGAAGIGGNPNSNVGDGYYGLTLDLDGNLTPDTNLNFYRLFGDTNGDRTVNSIDLTNINAAYGQSGPALDADINGDGLINILDRLYTFRALGRSINSALLLDD